MRRNRTKVTVLALLLAGICTLLYLLLSPPPSAPLAEVPVTDASTSKLNEATNPRRDSETKAVSSRESLQVARPKTLGGHASTALDLVDAERTRSDLKISLAALYGAQKSFYSEYARYSTDFNALGYSPEGKDIRHKTGFQRAYYPEETGASNTEKTSRQISSFDELDNFQRDTGGEGLGFSPSTKDVRLEDAFQYCRAGCTASETQFEVLAAANLDDDPDLDVWLINEKKELVHAHDDLAAGP